jgi:hypothetical protein
MDLALYYYKIDEAVENRSAMHIGVEGLEEFAFDEKTSDPYLQAIYAMHGIFSDIDVNKSFQLLNDIYNDKISYEGWNTMSTSIKAFVCYQLSLLYLGFQNYEEKSLEKANFMINESVKYGNHNAMQYTANEIFEENSMHKTKESHENISTAVQLFKKAISLGNKNAIEGLLSCWEFLEDFKSITEYFHEKFNLVEKLGSGIKEYTSLFNKFMVSSDDKEKIIEMFIKTIIVLKHEEVKKLMFKYSKLFCEKIFDDLNAQMINDQSSRDNILENILIVFNSNNLLYKGYMSKLLINGR